jgi:DNA-binding PadR family transcriptional regulator
MSSEHDQTTFPAPSGNREVTRLLEQIQALVPEIKELERRGAGDADLAAKRRALERLRWRLAAVARRLAHDEAA